MIEVSRKNGIEQILKLYISRLIVCVVAFFDSNFFCFSFNLKFKHVQPQYFPLQTKKKSFLWLRKNTFFKKISYLINLQTAYR